MCRDSNMKPGAHVLNRLIVPRALGGSEVLWPRRVGATPVCPANSHCRRAADFRRKCFRAVRRLPRASQRRFGGRILFDKIAEVTGHRPTKTPRRTVEAVRATQEQASRLAISVGDPLLFLNVCFAETRTTPCASAASTTWAAGTASCCKAKRVDITELRAWRWSI